MSFELAFQKTIMEHEGGSKVTDYKYDGHITKYGITQYLLDSYKINRSVKDFTKHDAKNFYKEFFWTKLRCYRIINFNIAYSLFDFAVNQGHKTAVKRIQESVNEFKKRNVLKVDGIIGHNTEKAINDIIDYTGFCKIYSKYKLYEYNKDLTNRLLNKIDSIMSNDLLNNNEKQVMLEKNTKKWFNIHIGWINRTYDTIC